MAYVVMNTAEVHGVQGLTTRHTEGQKEPLVAGTLDQFSGNKNCVWSAYSCLAAMRILLSLSLRWQTLLF